MFGAETLFLVITLAGHSLQQRSGQEVPRSPCPTVFMYDPSTPAEPGQWNGVVNLSTDTTLHSLWLNVVLDSKAEILGNWVGDVTTSDNIDFKIENTNMKIQPGPATAVKFFIKYNPLNKAPRVQAIRLNGREICNANIPQSAVDLSDQETRPTATTGRPISRPDNTYTKPDNIYSRPIDTRPIDTRPTDTRPIDTRPERPLESRPRPDTITARPIDTRPMDRPNENRPIDSRPMIRPDDTFETKPSKGKPTGDGPVYVPTQPPFDQSNVNPYSIGGGQAAIQNVVNPSSGGQPAYVLTTTSPVRPHGRPSHEDDYSESGKPNFDDLYFTGGRPVIAAVPAGDSNKSNEQAICGTVVRNNPNPLVVNGKPTLEGQWPWQIALYQVRGVDNKYICGGTLVSHKHVITAAHCVTLKSSNRPVNKNTLTVYLGKHNLRTSVEGVQIRFVGDIIVHPLYNATAFSKDLSVLSLLETVQYTDWVRPACLWPADLVDLTNVAGKKGTVVGWGFDDTGVASEELSLVEMPVVDQETCIRSHSEFFVRFTSEYTYCAGYRDGTSVCNGDSGGGMVFNFQNRWYLRGLVSLSVARDSTRCDPNHFVIFTDLAKFLPWLKQVISQS